MLGAHLRHRYSGMTVESINSSSTLSLLQAELPTAVVYAILYNTIHSERQEKIPSQPNNMSDIGQPIAYGLLSVDHSDSGEESDFELGELKTDPEEARVSTSRVLLNPPRHYNVAEQETVIRKLDRSVVLFAFLLCLTSLSDLTSMCSFLSKPEMIANIQRCWACKDCGSRSRSRSRL